LPHLMALVTLNEPSDAISNEALDVVASGHATVRTREDGTKERQYSVCSVSIKRLGSTMIE